MSLPTILLIAIAALAGLIGVFVFARRRAPSPAPMEAVTAPPATPLSSRPRLEVLSGPDRGACFEIGEARGVIGRQEGLAFRLSDPAGDLRVSREHAEAWIEAESAMIEDRQSTHGVVVNGARIRARQRLANGDRVLIGKVELVYHGPAAASPESPAERGRTMVMPGRQKPAPAAAGLRRTKARPDRGGQ